MFSFSIREASWKKKYKQQHEKIELLIYRIYCWQTKNKSFREMKSREKKSQPSKEGVYQHQISEAQTMKLQAEAEKKLAGMKALSKFFMRFNFWQIWHFKFAEFQPRIANRMLHSTTRCEYLARLICTAQRNQKTIRLSEKSISLPITSS